MEKNAFTETQAQIWINNFFFCVSYWIAKTINLNVKKLTICFKNIFSFF